MKLIRIAVHNYKSLRSVEISPSPLTVVVGPNAAGKTNFCDALDFLAEAYRLGLEVAVSRKGGYENICYRRARRSKSPVRFEVEFELTRREARLPPFENRRQLADHEHILFRHAFELKTESENIRAPFRVTDEELDVRLSSTEPQAPLLPLLDNSVPSEKLISILRQGDEKIEANFAGLDALAGSTRFSQYAKSFFGQIEGQDVPAHILPTELLISVLDRVFFGSSPFRVTLGSLRVFQLSPRSCRESGVPTPNPELERFGRNLPAVIEFLKTNSPDRYSLLLQTVKAVMPSLLDLQTQYTHTKTLGLFVSEQGIGQPWPAEDVSDGTIQTIALLAAVFDPRTLTVVIEEPENSIHPWAIRQFVEAARKASETKYVILTTHSPVLINQLVPKELWVARRIRSETKLDPVLDLDPNLEKSWGEGRFTLSEYLDSGALPDAVPSEQ